VGSRESKPEASLISNESPLGKAFLGKKAGDTVEIETPKGKAKYKILKIG
jgi:transcription elongation factor GreA